VTKGLLGVAWVVVGAIAGAVIGAGVGSVVGAAVSTIFGDTSVGNGDDWVSVLVGTIVATGCALIGAIAGAAGAVTWAIDTRRPTEPAPRFGDHPDDFR